MPRTLIWLTTTIFWLSAGGVWGIALSSPKITAGNRVVNGSFQEFGALSPVPLSELDWADNVPETELVAIYERIREKLKAGYQKSGKPVALVYQGWQRFNRVPYMSPAEGISFRNNYGNTLANAYRYPGRQRNFPVGAVLAKDSFVVTKTGQVYSGPLSLMEKMPPGFSPNTNDWRYTQIRADGTVLGTTNGNNADKMLFCVGCHYQAGMKADFAFSVPAAYRLPAAR